MKRLALISLLIVSCVCSRAQIAEVWLSMPDSLCPYLNEQQRLSMLQFAKAGLTDTIENQLEGTTYFDSVALDRNYIAVQMTSNLQVVLTIDKAADGSEQLCMRQTICAPICSTITTWYDFAWNMLRREKEPWEIEQTDEERQQLF